MTKYEINNKPYVTICSVNDEIKEIFNRIKKINPLSFESPNDLYNMILKEIEFGNTLVDVSKQMGQRMEDSLRYKSIWGYNSNYINEDQNDEED